MMFLKLLVLALWLISGVLVLSSRKVTKLEYGIVWGIYVFHLFSEVLEEMVI